MRIMRAGVLLATLLLGPLAPAFADSHGAPPTDASPTSVPPPGSGPVAHAPPVVTQGPVLESRPVRLAHLEHHERVLKRHIWHLRMRRRQFLVEGLPERAHRVSRHILTLGWQLRRVQTAERALRHH